MDMNDQRTARAAALRTEAQTHRDRGAALTALAALVVAQDVPVQRWRTYWRAVAEDCRRQAKGAHAHAVELDERAATVDMAVSARNGWQPAPGAADDV